MKKAIIGLAAVGAVIGLRPVAKRMSQKAREHCEEMAAHCKADHPMPERCKQMGREHQERSEPLAAA